VLVTGFGPFPGAWFNPTPALVQRFTRLRCPALAEVRLVGHVFETSYVAVETELPDLIERLRPDVVLMFGLAARTPFLRIEACARNVRSALLADVSGRTPVARGIVPGGPAQCTGRAPLTRLVQTVRASRTPVRLSRNAGRYLCNFAYWRALETAVPHVVFVHVPKLAVSARPRRARPRRRVTAAQLATAGEAVLRVLVAEARQSRLAGRVPA
jgi:pyroglutamyl-peptidase